MIIETDAQIEAWKSMVGLAVLKPSGKPFKSGNKVNTVIGTRVHQITGRLCFVFMEDDSHVECFRCETIGAKNGN
jgi:hypothetical protein